MIISQLAKEKFLEFDGHKLVSFFYDPAIGLKGFIAIHNTNLGPATGGTRYWDYKSDKEALRDALLLSKAMTYKCALAGVPYGGGKAVIIANFGKPKTKQFLKAYAEKINLLNGSFYTGEDMGMADKDIDILAKHSRFINGLSHLGGGPGSWAALSVFNSIQSALEYKFGSPLIKDRTFAIKGLGKVGMELCRLIYEQGGKIIASEINPAIVKLAQKKFNNIKITLSSEIHKQEVDVYSPCALGGEFNGKTIAQLKCKIICGAANNQLVSEQDGRRIFDKNIIYVPDYAANAGGLINVVAEWDKDGYNIERVKEKINNVKKTVWKILEISKQSKKPANQVADKLAEQVFLRGFKI